MSVTAQLPAMMRQPTATAEQPRGEQDAAAARWDETASAAEPVLCNHCGRTASNGLSCIGACVADSGY